MFQLLRHFLRKKLPYQTEKQLPQGIYQDFVLPHLNMDWATTYEFAFMAKRHCAAVCVCNGRLYLSGGKKKELFPAIHGKIGNGPVFSLRKAQPWLQRRNLRSYEELKAALASGHPCAILMANHIWDLHWVLAVGWREYDDGPCYIHIHDGWHSSADRWYRLDKGAEWLSAYELYLP